MKKSSISICKRTFFRFFNFDGSYFENHFSWNNVLYLIWKPWYSVPWSQKDRGRGLQTKPPHPFKWKQSNFIQVGVAALFGGHALCPSGSEELNIRAFIRVVMEYYSIFLIIRISNKIRILAGIIRIIRTRFTKSTFWACFWPRTMYVHQIKGLWRVDIGFFWK